MSRRPVLIAVGVVVLIAAAAVGVVHLAIPGEHHDPVADHSFEVDGQRFDCGTSGRVRPEAELFYPGPNPTIVLDGQPVLAGHPGGDQYEYRTLAPLPDFDCSDGETHTVWIENGKPPNVVDPGCQIRINPAVQYRAGYNSPDVPSYNADSLVCHVTWTD